MTSLKNHPFAVEAFFENSIVLTFAVLKEQVEHLIPECLVLDTYQNKWAFIAVAMVQTRDLRPKGFPKFMGHDFFLIGYRIFVRYRNTAGKRLRGLYILQSETDKKKMEFLGNIFTHYRYTTTDITVTDDGHVRTIRSEKSKFEVTLDPHAIEIPIPKGSPFPDWKEARKFAGPLPFTFTYNEENKTVLIIEGGRQHWIPQPLEIKNYSFDFMGAFNHAVLANAFEIRNIPYYWKKGRIEPWK